MKKKEITKMINNSKVLVEKHKHKIKLAYNGDEIISYCEECGKILDVYKRVYDLGYPKITWASSTSTSATANYGTLTSTSNTHI